MTNTPNPPLQGLRVLDVSDDSGRFATKVLSEMGASVLRVHDGRMVTHGPPMRDPVAAQQGGLLDWWYDAGKQTLPLDLGTPAGATAYRQLAERADLIVETLAPGRLGALGLDHANLSVDHRALVQVSLTPFGRTGPRAAWQSTDLVAAALGGTLSVCGLPEQAVVPWGRQSFAAGSLIAALSGLAGVRSARCTGVGQLVDVSLHEAVTSSLEQVWFQYHYDDRLPLPKIAPRQGSVHWSHSYKVVPCKTGWCMVTATPAPLALLAWLIEEGVPGAAELLGPSDSLTAAHGSLLVALSAELALRYDSGELFRQAQARHLAWGEVQTTAQLAANEQLRHRGAFVDVPGHPGVRRPRFPVVFDATPTDVPEPPSRSHSTMHSLPGHARCRRGQRPRRRAMHPRIRRHVRSTACGCWT